MTDIRFVADFSPQGSHRRITALLLAVILTIRFLVPPGFMAGSVAEGEPFVLCHGGLPVGIELVQGDHASHHGGSALDLCDLNDGVADSLAVVDLGAVHGHGQTILQASLATGRLTGPAIDAPRARGPPTLS